VKARPFDASMLKQNNLVIERLRKEGFHTVGCSLAKLEIRLGMLLVTDAPREQPFQMMASQTLKKIRNQTILGNSSRRATMFDIKLYSLR